MLSVRSCPLQCAYSGTECGVAAVKAPSLPAPTYVLCVCARGCVRDAERLLRLHESFERDDPRLGHRDRFGELGGVCSFVPSPCVAVLALACATQSAHTRLVWRLHMPIHTAARSAVLRQSERAVSIRIVHVCVRAFVHMLARMCVRLCVCVCVHVYVFVFLC